MRLRGIISFFLLIGFAVIGAFVYLKFNEKKDFYTVDGRSWNWGEISGSRAIIVYVDKNELEPLIPWLHYWSQRPDMKFVGLVNYSALGENEFNLKVAQLKDEHIVVLKDFDSSPFALMPMAQTPAVYSIETNKVAQGPFYYYYEAPC